ncbi:hypothetical protein, variant [Aphanomyces invadans]|uniref:Uncharacterized protein n=1 Tax=Aphanomyces invadans TaxID=157072 RepID=A0A024TM40_9STRA|nr:hypothetical protein, variant [Aphanomyces invadans]ETV94696.1 hypothetical protein, variant [Aphanomyces invadans]|eukprot:XP_008876640.1 hypothetical protein, variant [Aphanomyces invadans]
MAECTWCKCAKWTVECDACARPSGVKGAVRHCRPCSDAWHAVGASRHHARRDTTADTAIASVEDALEAQIQEKMLLLRQALDAPQDDAVDSTTVPTADQPAVDSSKPKPLDTALFEQPLFSGTNSMQSGTNATACPTSSSQSDKKTIHDSSSSLDSSPTEHGGPEIVFIDDDNDMTTEVVDEADDELKHLEPLNIMLIEQLRAYCIIHDAVNCVHFTQCRDNACVSASRHLKHCAAGVSCPDRSAMCRAFANLTQHCETCPHAATCALCVHVLQRRLQYTYVALSHALSVVPPPSADVPVAEAKFQAHERQSLMVRKQTCELELKEAFDVVRRLQLPTTKLPPIQNHFCHVAMPTWKRRCDPISEYIFQGNATNVATWREWVHDGLHITNATNCKYTRYCQRECAAWAQRTQTYDETHKVDPTKVLSTREGAAIARHRAHYPCKFQQCMYCNLMRRNENEVKHAMAALCVSKLAGLLSRERNPTTLRQLEANFRRFEAFQGEIEKKLRWYAQVLPLWSRPHIPIVETPGYHYSS